MYLNLSLLHSRRSDSSRKAAADAIVRRARSPLDWLQVFIFPEGTNSNRKQLIKFKNGAFNPGRPVQPVVIRYPGYGDGHDAITWTFKQAHSYLFSVWLLLSRPVNEIEVEFLPVYAPDEAERADPELFARRVQELMARELGVPALDVTYHKSYAEHCQKHGMEVRTS